MEALAGDLGAEVVGAHAHVGGVGHTASGVGNSVSENIVGGGNSGSIGQAIGVSGVSESTIAVGTEAIGVSIGAIEDSGIGLSLSLGLGISGPLAIVVSVSGVSISVSVVSAPITESVSTIAVVSVVSISLGLSLRLGISGPLAVGAVGNRGIGVSSVGKGGSGAGDGKVCGVHAGGGLACEGMEPIGVRVAIAGIKDGGVSLSLSIGGSNNGNCDSLDRTLSGEIFSKSLFCLVTTRH